MKIFHQEYNLILILSVVKTSIGSILLTFREKRTVSSYENDQARFVNISKYLELLLFTRHCNKYVYGIFTFDYVIRKFLV